MVEVRKYRFITFWLCVAIATFAYYFKVSGFGLYEDDFVFVGVPISFSSLNDLWLAIFHEMVHWPEGRPLGFILPLVFSYLGEQAFHSLVGLYFFGWLLFSICLYSLFTFSRYLFDDVKFCFLVTLIFALWPADTNKALLTHTYILYPSLTFFLFSFICHFRNKKMSSSILLMLSFLTYESTVALALIVPVTNFFIERTTKITISRNEKIRTLCRDYVRISAVILLYIFSRTYFFHETRVWNTESDISDLFMKMVDCLYLGPMTLVSAPFLFKKIDPSLFEILIATVLGLLVFVFLIVRIKNKPIKLGKDSFFFKYMACLVGFGILWLMVAYPIYSLAPERFPPTMLVGRMNGIHQFSSVGLAIAIGGVGAIGLQISRRSQILIALLMAIMTSVYTMYGFDVQKDFVKAWADTRHRWNRYFDQLPDILEDSVIFVSEKIENTYHISSYSWYEPKLFTDLLIAPKVWKRYPLIFSTSVHQPESASYEVQNRAGVVDLNVPSLFRGYRENNQIKGAELITCEERNESNLDCEVGKSQSKSDKFKIESIPIKEIEKKNLYRYLMNF